MVGKGIVIVVFVVAIGIGAFVLTGQEFPDFQLGTLIEGGGFIGTMIADIEETPPLLGVQNFGGNLNLSWDGRDTLDRSVLYDQQFFGIECFERIGDDLNDWEFLSAGGNAVFEATVINIRKTSEFDSGLTEIWCQITSQQQFPTLIDIDGTIKANQRLDLCIFEIQPLSDIFRFEPSWNCRINLLDISETDSKITPSLKINLKLIAQANNVLLDQTTTVPINIGTGDKVNRIKYNANFGTDETAKALSQVKISVQPDCGDGASACPKISVEELEKSFSLTKSFIEVPVGDRIQTIRLIDMERNELSSKITYKWKYDEITGFRDVASANFIVVAKTEDPLVDFPLIFVTKFTSNDISNENTLCIELELEFVNDFNEFETTEQDVELVASTVNDNGVCVIP